MMPNYPSVKVGATKEVPRQNADVSMMNMAATDRAGQQAADNGITFELSSCQIEVIIFNLAFVLPVTRDFFCQDQVKA